MFPLRPYQRAAVEATITHFRGSDETACLVLPTGAGKSLVIAELARLARGRILVLAHVRELCEQNFAKFKTTGGDAGLFAAGSGQRQATTKVVFATIQSACANMQNFRLAYSMVIIDECHRVTNDTDSQYQRILTHLRGINSTVRVLGLTATPYRLGLGFIYQYHYRGIVRSTEPRPFATCVFEVTLRELIGKGYLTRPRLIDAPVAQYDFSGLSSSIEHETSEHETGEHEVNDLLLRHPRVTQSIVEQIVQLAKTRRGVMIFAATIAHAREISGYLPEQTTAVIIGETSTSDRDAAIVAFKEQRLKFLINVAVLTTGFDAPHVDFIAILRPTQSITLFQQIVGRGLRLFPGKQDCLVVDYAGNGYDLHTPELGVPRPSSDSVVVDVPCPACAHVNQFWGVKDADGNVLEHHGRRCTSFSSVAGGAKRRCDYRFRFKECPRCAAENDIAARVCTGCQCTLVDPDDRLRDALGLKNARVLRVAGLTLNGRGERVDVTYHDEDGLTLTEYFNFANPAERQAFNRIFRRRRGTAAPLTFHTADAAKANQASLTPPDFVVGRRKGQFFRVAERIFDYQGRYRKAGELH